MKKILGLDLGTTSIGWALVNESSDNKSEIIKLGVRVNPITTDEQGDFEKGKSISNNAERTTKRGARRNLQRFKQRRKNLIRILIENGLITKETPLTEMGKDTTHLTLSLRAQSAKEKINSEDLAKIFLTINKKRGYKSSRKVSNDDQGQAIDGMTVAKTLYSENLTSGQYVLQELESTKLENNKKYIIPDFYRSDLQNEFDAVWNFQKQFYAKILTDELKEELKDKNKGQTWKICEKPFDIVGINPKGKANEKRLACYQWRVKGLSKKLELEYLAIVLQEINNNLNQSSGYLGAISDRSKELYFKKITVGEYLYGQINENPHTSLRNQVFYRQDYLDEFEKIWETQAKFHPQLTNELKEEIRDVIIFYQRKLKSQKGLLSFCEFESREESYINKDTGKDKTRIIGNRVISKSSPLFQEFKIWQNLNNLEFNNKNTNGKIVFKELDEEIRQEIFEPLNIRGDLKSSDLLKLLSKHIRIDKPSDWKCNFKKIEGNRTNQSLYEIYQQIAENKGCGFDWEKKTAPEIKKRLNTVFSEMGIDPSILDFDAYLENPDFDKQASYQLWHLLYSAEDDVDAKVSEEDRRIYGNSSVALKKKLCTKYGFKPAYAKMLSNISLQQDYGNLSSKAIRKIIPYLQQGHIYSEACVLAGYNHSKSETKEEKENKKCDDKLEPLRKNSLRNPVVEKILNQMVNVVNQLIDEHGKPDEVRIELARELKKSAKERADMTTGINEATKYNNKVREKIAKLPQFNNGASITRNDVIRYKLWEELLVGNGYKDVFTNKQIKEEDIFSGKVDIEHIIPKALLFDDSFSNKTLAFRKVNLKKSDRTALDFITQDYSTELHSYKARVESLYNNGKGKLHKAKRNKLLMSQQDLPEGFINRDLRDSQYIAKQAKTMLKKVFKDVVSTSGNITGRLREDWGLINVMKELNLPKYRDLGLTEYEERKNGKKIEVIKNWTKRNDHRHHAMDALTVAFTKHAYVQYLNYLNARKDEKHKEHRNIITIEDKYTDKEGGKRKFIPPMDDFRSKAKEHIASILISFKNKNKVFTKNVNKIKRKKGIKEQQTLTPRGQLHKETVYGKCKQLEGKPTRLSKKFTLNQIDLIANPVQKELILDHIAKFKNNPELAFDSKNLKQGSLLYKNKPLKEVLCFEEVFTIRKDITPELKVEKVIDGKIRNILQDRLSKYNNDSKEAFSNLDKNPIWLNKGRGISIKRVTIKGVSNAEPLHDKKDHLGQNILDARGNEQEVDFVQTGNNHHLAVFVDGTGKLQDRMVSFYEAVERANQGLPIIDKSYKEDEGWKFLFTIKTNEMFVFPSDDFNPNKIDLTDKANYKIISKHLFRVQKISKKDFWFRHHLETTVETVNELKGKSFIRVTDLEKLKDIVKVRINHTCKIVKVGEY